MNQLRQAALEREQRRQAQAATDDAGTETSFVPMPDTPMEQPAEEEKKEEEQVEQVDGEMAEEEENNFAGDDGWEQDDGDEGAGWDDYGDDEDELPEVVKQALEQTRKKKEMDAKISEERITFRPIGYHDMTIARIVGDFTDWVPVTMHMHQVKDIQLDPTKRGEFFVQVKLVKGYRYRFNFEVDGSEILD